MGNDAIDVAKLFRQIGEANAVAESNSERLSKVEDAVVAVHKRLDNQIIEQGKQFTHLQDKMEKNAKDSTAEHSELARKVESLTHNIGGCIHEHVEHAVSPVLTEVRSHRKIMWSIAGGLIALLLTIIGYLLVNGSPWNAAIIDHANGSYHLEPR